MKITQAWLAEREAEHEAEAHGGRGADACADALELFAWVFPDGMEVTATGVRQADGQEDGGWDLLDWIESFVPAAVRADYRAVAYKANDVRNAAENTLRAVADAVSSQALQALRETTDDEEREALLEVERAAGLVFEAALDAAIQAEAEAIAPALAAALEEA
jgi:hypothetical protein